MAARWRATTLRDNHSRWGLYTRLSTCNAGLNLRILALRPRKSIPSQPRRLLPRAWLRPAEQIRQIYPGRLARGAPAQWPVMWMGGGPLKQSPANGFTYNGNATFGLGDMLLATNYFVVYSGSTTNVTLTNLPTGSICNVALFAYTGSGTNTAYNKTPALATFSTGSAVATNTSLLVDPASPALTNYTSLGEWNTDGNFESWTTGQITNIAVAGGLLAGGASGTDSQLLRTNIAGGPDLDLGFNDYLELRMQLPPDYN